MHLKAEPQDPAFLVELHLRRILFRRGVRLLVLQCLHGVDHPHLEMPFLQFPIAGNLLLLLLLVTATGTLMHLGTLVLALLFSFFRYYACYLARLTASTYPNHASWPKTTSI